MASGPRRKPAETDAATPRSVSRAAGPGADEFPDGANERIQEYQTFSQNRAPRGILRHFRITVVPQPGIGGYGFLSAWTGSGAGAYRRSASLVT